jgi:hypothetical protein
MTTFQLNGAVVSPSVTTAVSALSIPNGSNGVILTNPSATHSLFVHFVPQGATAPLVAEVLRGVRVYPGTYTSIAIMNEPPYGCDVYLAMEAGASATTINVYGVI